MIKLIWLDVVPKKSYSFIAGMIMEIGSFGALQAILYLCYRRKLKTEEIDRTKVTINNLFSMKKIGCLLLFKLCPFVQLSISFLGEIVSINLGPYFVLVFCGVYPITMGAMQHTMSYINKKNGLGLDMMSEIYSLFFASLPYALVYLGADQAWFAYSVFGIKVGYKLIAYILFPCIRASRMKKGEGGNDAEISSTRSHLKNEKKLKQEKRPSIELRAKISESHEDRSKNSNKLGENDSDKLKVICISDLDDPQNNGHQEPSPQIQMSHQSSMGDNPSGRVKDFRLLVGSLENSEKHKQQKKVDLSSWIQANRRLGSPKKSRAKSPPDEKKLKKDKVGPNSEEPELNKRKPYLALLQFRASRPQIESINEFSIAPSSIQAERLFSLKFLNLQIFDLVANSVVVGLILINKGVAKVLPQAKILTVKPEVWRTIIYRALVEFGFDLTMFLVCYKIYNKAFFQMKGRARLSLFGGLIYLIKFYKLEIFSAGLVLFLSCYFITYYLMGAM